MLSITKIESYGNNIEINTESDIFFTHIVIIHQSGLRTLFNTEHDSWKLV